MLAWFKNVTPHKDIREGYLDESQFAANLSAVASGSGREIYQNPEAFFSKTYFTKGLINIAKRVINGLNGKEDSDNRVISLQTGFGGGKTHSLIALFHLAHYGKKAFESESLKSYIKEIGIPSFNKANVAVFTNTTNDPTQGRKIGELHIRTIWGEIAHQLGGIDAYNIIKDNDQNRTAPKGLYIQVLQKCTPCLILIDELADYCIAASAIQSGDSYLSDQTISFIQEISEAISQVNHCMLVATLPASPAEVASSEKAAKILTSLQNRLSRVGKDTQPVADEEIFEVVRRRLFESIGDKKEIEKVISSYFNYYQQSSSEIPNYATKTDFKDKLLKSYPFHPALIDMFRIRWASHHDFQRTRGVLRLLGSIISDLWKRQGSLPGSNGLIHTSDINFLNLEALTSQLKKLYGNGYDAVISADVSGSSSTAFRIDADNKEIGVHDLTKGIAATILLGSFGSTGANKGISLDELKLAIIKPDSFNHNSVNGALDYLEGRAVHLYYSSTGTITRRYWFDTKPNINILINKVKNEISTTEIEKEIISRINKRVGYIQKFHVLVDPSEDIPEQKRLTLVVLHPKYSANPRVLNGNTKPIIEKLATKRGNSDRVYRNTMLFMVCSEIALGLLQDHAREYLACEKIQEEYLGQMDQDDREKIKKRLTEYSSKTEDTLIKAYSIIVKHSASQGYKSLLLKSFKDTIDAQINNNVFDQLKDEEWLLERVGIQTLKNNNLYPTIENHIKAKDVYEAFLRFDDKHMIVDVNAIQTSILRYCEQGEFAIAMGDGKDFNKIVCGESLQFFDVQDDRYWLVDKSLYKPKEEDPKKEKDDEDSKEKPDVKEPEKDKEPDKSSESKKIKKLTISGNVDVANYNQLFSSFVMPLAQNNIKIRISIEAESTYAKPITENSDQYKITKESAKQLGLEFEEE